MTPSQLTTFKAAMLADANVTAFITAGNHGAVAGYYNGDSATSVWKPSVTVQEMNSVIAWAAFAALSVQLQNAYIAMTQGGQVDATSATVRAGFTTIFGAGSTLTALTALAQRLATRFEALFTTANVTSMFGYQVTPADVAAALSA